MQVLSRKGSYRVLSTEYWWTTIDHQNNLRYIEIPPQGQNAWLCSLQLCSALQGRLLLQYFSHMTFSHRLAGGSIIAIMLFSPPCLSDLSLPMKVHHTLSGNLEPMHMEILGEIGTNIARLKWHWNLNKIDDWHAIYITTSQYFCVFSGLKDPKSKTYRLDCFTLPWVIAP